MTNLSEINPLIVDSHEDLAWNMLTFQRDYSLSSQQIRANERNTQAPEHNGDTLLGWDDYQTANVAVIFSTLFAAPIKTKEGEWDTQTYRSQEEAHYLYRAQLDTYRRLTDDRPEKFRLLCGRNDLADHLKQREQGSRTVGLLPLMEGADGIRSPKELPEWVEVGVRLIGLAWAGTHYSGGTREPGPLSPDGFELLRVMEDLDCTLDLSHMDELAVKQALDAFSGPLMASHINPNRLLLARRSNRFLNDDIILAIAERKGVMGLVPYNVFLDSEWKKGDDRSLVPLERYVEHIDYVCQLTGSAEYVGIGTDFDGGYGLQHVPAELNSIADLPKIRPLLEAKGYSAKDIANIFRQNWIRFLMEALP